MSSTRPSIVRRSIADVHIHPTKTMMDQVLLMILMPVDTMTAPMHRQAHSELNGNISVQHD